MKPVQPALSSASTLRAHALPARLREDAEAEAEMIKVQAEFEANKMKEQAMAEAQKLMDRAEAAVRAARVEAARIIAEAQAQASKGAPRFPCCGSSCGAHQSEAPGAVQLDAAPSRAPCDRPPSPGQAFAGRCVRHGGSGCWAGALPEEAGCSWAVAGRARGGGERLRQRV